MKIKQEDLKPGDIVLISKNACFVVGRIIHITKSGSVRYAFDAERKGIIHYYDFKTKEIEYNKTAYIQKPWKPEYQRYFWLLHREN